MPADRMLWLLRKVSGIAKEGQPILIDPAPGVQVQDEYGHLHRFTFASSGS